MDWCCWSMFHFRTKPPVNHLAITDLQHSKPQEDGIWPRTALSQLPNSISTWVEKIVNEWMMDYFCPAGCSVIYLFISFTFRGIIANRYWDLHRLFLSVMCPPYENWSSYWLSCPQQVKSVNGSIPILTSKKDQFSLWCVRKLRLCDMKTYSLTPLQRRQALTFGSEKPSARSVNRKIVFGLSFTVNCIIGLLLYVDTNWRFGALGGLHYFLGQLLYYNVSRKPKISTHACSANATGSAADGDSK